MTFYLFSGSIYSAWFFGLPALALLVMSLLLLRRRLVRARPPDRNRSTGASAGVSTGRSSRGRDR